MELKPLTIGLSGTKISGWYGWFCMVGFVCTGRHGLRYRLKWMPGILDEIKKVRSTISTVVLAKILALKGSVAV